LIPLSSPTRALLLVAVVAACAETTGVDRSQPGVNRWDLQPRFHYYEDGPQQPPPEAPAGHNWFTKITVEAAAGFHTGPADEGSRVSAWGQSVVNYTGTNATAHVYLDILYNRDVVDRANAPAEDSNAWPWPRGLIASVSRPVGQNCDLVAAVIAVGSVWNQFLLNGSWIMFGKKTGSDNDDEAQPRCNPTGGGGGGGDGWVTLTNGAAYTGGAPQREYCEKTHYFVSTDGGHSWRWDRTVDHGCYDIM
jgi:hypothetical protein